MCKLPHDYKGIVIQMYSMVTLALASNVLYGYMQLDFRNGLWNKAFLIIRTQLVEEKSDLFLKIQSV